VASSPEITRAAYEVLRCHDESELNTYFLLVKAQKTKGPERNLLLSKHSG
jgi:hypothetical protein